MKISINNPTSNFSYNSFTNSTVTMKAVCRKVTRKNVTLTTQKMRDIHEEEDVRNPIAEKGVRKPSEPISVSY